MKVFRAWGAFVVACAGVAGARAPISAGVAIGPGAIVGSVRDSSGRPVAGALVVAIGPTSREAITSSAGIVTLQALPLGSYSVRATRAGFAPYGTRVTLAGARSAPTVVRLWIAPESFANLHGAGNFFDTIALPETDTFVSHSLERAVDANVAAAPGGAVGLALLGTSPNETRVELDGIPLAGGSTSLAALQLRNALGLSSIELVRGPVVASSSLRDAIGGVINYRTPDIDAPVGVAVAFGYDSSFGAFQHVRANERAGKLGMLTDVVAGGGVSRSQTLKVRYTLSRKASLAYAQYGAQTTARVGMQNVTANAPAFAADLRAAIGPGTLEARAFGSSSEVVSSARVPSLADLRESARIHGVQARYSLPAGASLIGLSFDRRSDDTRDLSRTYTTAAARADIPLFAGSRIELGDVYSGGSSLAPRHDPQVALAFRPTSRTTLRFSAGGAYANAPDALLQRDGGRDGAGAAATRVPETSFGYRLGIDEGLADGDRAWVSLDALRRFNRFATLVDARSAELELGYERTIVPGRFGGSAYVRIRHAAAYGPAQPGERNVELDARGVAGEAFAGDPYAKARAAVGYAAGAQSFAIGATYLGAHNALASRAVVLGDAHVRVRFGNLLDVAAGVDNIFRVITMDPALRSSFAPRELTLTIGRFAGP